MPGPAIQVTDEPRELGFDETRIERAFGVVRRFVEEGSIPGAVALAGTAAGALAPRAFGYQKLVPEREPASPETIYDCASVTKVVVTTTLALVALESGLLRLDDRVASWVPGFADGPGQDPKARSEVTLRHLLTHTSGLTAWAPLFEGRKRDDGDEPGRGEDAGSLHPVIRRICREPLAYAPGSAVVYSCLGFILLGHIVSRALGAPLDALARRLVFEPLGMDDARFCPPPELATRIAATEVVDGSPLVGVVHDENARALGGLSGNAGLFATALDLARFSLMMLQHGRLGESRLLSPAAVAEATRDHTGHLGASRGLGWVIKGQTPFSPAGDLFSPESFGHTGFTGTSLWIDPVRGVFAVLLTNRVHPSRANEAHVRLRPLFHNAVAAAV